MGELAEEERDQGSRVTPGKCVSGKEMLPGCGGNNLPKNSIIGPLISFTAKRSSGTLSGSRALGRENARRIPVHHHTVPERCRPK